MRNTGANTNARTDLSFHSSLRFQLRKCKHKKMKKVSIPCLCIAHVNLTSWLVFMYICKNDRNLEYVCILTSTVVVLTFPNLVNYFLSFHICCHYYFLPSGIIFLSSGSFAVKHNFYMHIIQLII